MGTIDDVIVKSLLQKRRWPLLLSYLGIPAYFISVKFLSGLAMFDTVGDQNFLMGCGVLLLVSGILYPAVLWPLQYVLRPSIRRGASQATTEVSRQRSKRLWVGGFLALAGLLLVLAGIVPPPISDDPLVVGIATFTPIIGSEKDAVLFKDTLTNRLNALNDEKPDRKLLRIKNIDSEVNGTMTDERIRFGKRLGMSWTTNVHILVGGKVITRTDKEKPGTYIAPYLAFIRPLRETRTSEKKIPRNFQAEPELIEFPEVYASSIADVALFVYGLAHYRAHEWDRAIQILESVDSKEALFYKALSLQQRAKQAQDPTTDLGEAVSAYRRILGNDPREWQIADGSDESDKLTRAAYYSGAEALAELARLKSPEYGLLLFGAARELFENALVVRTREKIPLEWAWVQNNLGNVLIELGTRISDKNFEAAENAYSQALQVYGQDEQKKYPEEWVTTRNNLAAAFTYLGGREDGANDKLKDAVTTYKQVIRSYEEARSAQDLAMAYSNLGYALTLLGSREDGANDYLRNARRDCEKALEIRTQESSPQDWAYTQLNLAYALRELGKRVDGDDGTDMMRQAVSACEAALGVYNKEGSLTWAMTKDSLGRSQCDLGLRLGGEEGKRFINRALQAHAEAISVHTRDSLPQMWAYTQSNIAKALVALIKLEGGDDRRQQAVVMLKDLQTFYRESQPAQYNEMTALLASIS